MAATEDDVEKAIVDTEVVKAVIDFHDEAKEAKQLRMRLSEANVDAYHGKQDWSHKIEGQSKEFLPKTSQTAEQFCAFIEKGLTQFGDWFSVEVPKDSPLTPEGAREILKCFLAKLPDGMEHISFETRVSDGTKVALLEAMMILKVHGYKKSRNVFHVEDGELVTKKMAPWNLQIDLIPPQDYFPDPTGRGLYEVHVVERDLSDLDAMAEKGVYKKSVLDRVRFDYQRDEDERRNDPSVKLNQPPSTRKRCVLKEFWGTLLKPDGSVWMRDVVCTVINDKYLLREPEPYPYWHGESCFVKIPLLRVPFSVWHKALYDQVVPLNLALNELFNLMLDGGISSVWGIKQLRMDFLEDPRQVSGGIPQGKTLSVKADMPEGMKVLENVTEGQVPQDAMAMFGVLDREVTASAMTNDIKQGNLPQRQVKATEIVETSQAHGVLLDSIVTKMERGIAEALRKAWLTIMQNLDDVSANELQEHVSPKELLMLARMSPAERFAMFGPICKFKVHGLSSTLARARDFPKVMALLQVAQQNPLLAPVMMERMSGNKLWDFCIKMLNLNPQKFEMDEDEKQKVPGRLALFQQMNAKSGENVVTEPTGEPGTPSEIHQNTMGSSGL